MRLFNEANFNCNNIIKKYLWKSLVLVKFEGWKASRSALIAFKCHGPNHSNLKKWKKRVYIYIYIYIQLNKGRKMRIGVYNSEFNALQSSGIHFSLPLVSDCLLVWLKNNQYTITQPIFSEKYWNLLTRYVFLPLSAWVWVLLRFARTSTWDFYHLMMKAIMPK